MINKLTNMISFYTTYEQDSQMRFESQIKINKKESIIKQLQQIDANNFANHINKLIEML